MKKLKIKQNKAITLIALVITIIILLILAGITISALTNTGLFGKANEARETSIKAQLKEEIEMAITDIQIDKISRGEDITLEILKNELPNKLEITAELNNEEVTGEYKGYNYNIDSAFNVTIGDEANPKLVTFSEIEWNNGKAQVTLSTKMSSAIEYQINGTTEDGWIQGTLVSELNLNDVLYARLTGKTEIEKLEIKDIIKPEEFEITVTDVTSTGLSITGSTVDNQSGIANYTYIVKTITGNEKKYENITETTYVVTELEPYTEYTVYMLAYDNSGNARKSNEETVKTKEYFNETEKTIEGESLISCIQDNELESGNYLLKVNGEEYSAEIYNYNEDVSYLVNTELGKEDEDGRMVICKYNKNMTVAEGVTLTTTTSRKGLFIYVAETLKNDGEISMSGKGAHAEGQNIYLWKNSDEDYEFVPAAGGTGGASVSVSAAGGAAAQSKAGNVGKDGQNRQTGGGGAGMAYVKNISATWVKATAISGAGSAGTSYSGGVGGEQARLTLNSNSNETLTANAGQTNGGNKAGGLIIIKSNMLDNSNGKITANSLISGNGGGSINIFVNDSINEGTIEVNGLGNGGKGTFTINDI